VNPPKILEMFLRLAVVAVLACGVAWIALGRRRAEAREQDWQRQGAACRARADIYCIEQALRMDAAGMPANHPDTPGPPPAWELAWLGDTYGHFASQLADIGADW